jgi:hypothetical protein
VRAVILPTCLSALLSVACAHSRSSVERSVGEAEAIDQHQADEMQQLASGMTRLLQNYADVDQRLHDAAQRYGLAAQTADRASQQFITAEQNYRDAERHYRWTFYTLMIAAAMDVAAENVCQGVESTRAFRRENGIDDSEVCIDHVFPHALGGVNSPWNYNPIPCRENSALGATFWGKAMTYPLPMLQGLLATALARLRCAGDTAAWSR